MGGVADFVSDTVGGVLGTKDASEGQQKAAATQAEASDRALDVAESQFAKIQENILPYLTAGESALAQQQNIVGLSGNEAQQAAIAEIENSPYFQSLTQQGEDAILQNAAATGGLRGGNVQRALSEFRPAQLNALIQQRYGNLGGLTSLGQASTALQAAQSNQFTNTSADLLAQRGAAIAGGQIARGNERLNTINTGLNVAKQVGGFFF